MSQRIEKLNKHIQRIFGAIIQSEADLPSDVLVTISRVDTTPNLQSTNIWLYIQPLGRGEEVLAMLKGQLYDLQGALNRELQMRPLPRIFLHIDLGSEYAEHIEKKLVELKGNDRTA